MPDPKKLADRLLAKPNPKAADISVLEFDGGFYAVADAWVEKLRAKHGDEGVVAHFQEVFSKFPSSTAKANPAQPRDGRTGRFRQRYENELTEEMKAEAERAAAYDDEDDKAEPRKPLALPWKTVSPEARPFPLL